MAAQHDPPESNTMRGLPATFSASRVNANAQSSTPVGVDATSTQHTRPRQAARPPKEYSSPSKWNSFVWVLSSAVRVFPFFSCHAVVATAPERYVCQGTGFARAGRVVSTSSSCIGAAPPEDGPQIGAQANNRHLCPHWNALEHTMTGLRDRPSCSALLSAVGGSPVAVSKATSFTPVQPTALTSNLIENIDAPAQLSTHVGQQPRRRQTSRGATLSAALSCMAAVPASVPSA